MRPGFRAYALLHGQMERPRCPNPEHAGSRVTRAGWYGKAPHRHQLWWCRTADGQKHRFAELLPRRETPSCTCRECSTVLEQWEGQPSARQHSFSAREIAAALVLVARGESYRRAAENVRKTSGRWLDGSFQRSFTHRQDRRDENADGQIVANWIDTLAPALLEEKLPTSWPHELVVDSVEFRIKNGWKAGASYHVFVAVGYEGGYIPRPVVWKMQAFGSKSQRAWREFFSSLNGRPEILVSDMDSAIRGAARAVFQKSGGRPTELRLCEFHLRRSLETTLSRLQGIDPPPEPLAKLELAFTSETRWEEFVAAVSQEDTFRTPLPNALRWIKRYGREVASQAATRRNASVHSTAAAENTIRQVRSSFDGRSANFGNRRRVNLLLGLMTLDQRGQAHELEWAERIRGYLSAHAGRAPEQGRYNDPRFMPSLLVP
jgi:hypothetical protein